MEHQKKQEQGRSQGAILGHFLKPFWELKIMFLCSLFIAFLTFLRARNGMEALVYAHFLSENHVFEEPVELKKE